MTLLEKYYNKFNEDHRLSTRHGLVEFKTSLFYIEQAIDEIKKAINKQNNEIKILDDGAGTGKYSIELHNKGYDVTAVELVKRNLDVLRNKHLNIKTWQGDARNLSFLEDNSFDITLIFGPLYHLHSEEDKLKVFSEATRITKNNGIIL
ncbi:MAG: class I SAM-dependent methyltransferase, partial [Treponema sp.]|nr:class I SAM-dependent methyltransferase [Treponema sp.]